MELARKAFRLDTTNKWYHQFYGQALIYAGRYDEALKVYRRLQTENPKDPDNYRILAALYEQKQSPVMALVTLDSAELRFGRIPVLSAMKRRLLVATNQIDKAVVEARAMVEAAPYEAQRHVVLGDLYAIAKKDSLARAEYDRALQIDSTNVQTLMALADFHAGRQDYRALLAVTRQLFQSDELPLETKIKRFGQFTSDTRFYREYYFQLKVIFAVEARVGGELPEAFDLGFERQFVGLEQLPRDGQQRPVILPSGVKIGQRHQRLYVCGVDLQRAVVFGAGQRILLGDGVEVAEDHVALRLIGGSFDHRPGFDHGFVDLVRRHQQTPFHGAQHGNAPEAQFGRIECHEGHDGTLLLLVEGRQNAVVVGVFRVLRLQAAVDLQRLVVTPGVDERLSVELVIPLVRRVEPESLPGQFHG